MYTTVADLIEMVTFFNQGKIHKTQPKRRMDAHLVFVLRVFIYQIKASSVSAIVYLRPYSTST